MKRVLIISFAVILSIPAFAQTQQVTVQAQSTSCPVTIGSAVVTAAGVVGGLMLGNYLIGGYMAPRFAADAAFQFGRYSSARMNPFRMGVIPTVIVSGSGVLGGYIAACLTR